MFEEKSADSGLVGPLAGSVFVLRDYVLDPLGDTSYLLGHVVRDRSALPK